MHAIRLRLDDLKFIAIRFEIVMKRTIIIQGMTEYLNFPCSAEWIFL